MYQGAGNNQGEDVIKNIPYFAGSSSISYIKSPASSGGYQLQYLVITEEQQNQDQEQD